MTPLLRRVGAGSSRVDPYWDFDHAAGWDATARRIERVRVRVPGSEPAEVRVRLARVDGADLVDLPPAEHVLRFTGGTPTAPEAYVPAPPRLVAPPPLLVLALDVTGLSPGEHVLTTSAPGRDPEELRVLVERRPFHAPPPGVPAGARFAVRSATGLGRAEDRGAVVPATAHRFRLLRHAWAPVGRLRGGYRVEATIDVVAITLFDRDLAPVVTRWRTIDAGEALDATALTGPDGVAPLRAPRELEDEARGFGVPFPELVGLATQPGPDGAHPSR